MRVVFFGTSAFALPALEQLCAHHQVVLVVTQPDRPQGRGLTLEASPIKTAAVRLGIPIAQPQRLDYAAVSSMPADIGVVASYGQLIRREVMGHFPHGILGIHPSLLPKYRGAAPVAWAILNGETITGVTIFRINEALDAGPMLIRREVVVDPMDSSEALTHRLALLGAEETIRAIALIDSGEAAFIPQEESLATVAPKLSKVLAEVNWADSSLKIGCHIRAMNPWPVAWTIWQGQAMKLWAAQPVEALPAQPSKPGSVVAASGGKLIVATGEGLISLDQVQLPGKRKITAREFLSGYSVSVGELLGAGSH